METVVYSGKKGKRGIQHGRGKQRNKVETVVYSRKKRNIARKREREENRGTKWIQWYTAGKRAI